MVDMNEFTNKKLCDKIDSLFKSYCYFDYEPNVANVVIKWKDNNETTESLISINDVDEKFDDSILFYCDSLNDLKSLTNENNGEDFVLIDVFSFNNLK